MVTSRKYITMNIRRPTSAIENNIDSPTKTTTNTSQTSLTTKKMLSMHMNQTPSSHHQQQQHSAKTYLPLKRALNITNKKPANAAGSLNSSLTNSSNSKIDLNHNSSDNMSKTNSQITTTTNSHSEKDYTNHINNTNNNTSCSSSENTNSNNNEETTTNSELKNHHLEKKKIELINIPTKRLVNPNSETTRLRQSFFMNEFPISKSSSSTNNTKTEMQIPNQMTNIQASFERYENDSQENNNTKSATGTDNKSFENSNNSKAYLNTSPSNTKSSFEYNSTYSAKYSPNTTLPSKHNLNRSSSNQKTKFGMKSTEKVSETKPLKASHLNKSHTQETTNLGDKNRGSNILSSTGNMHSPQTTKSQV